VKTSIADTLADEIMENLDKSRIWMADCDGVSLYRGHAPRRDNSLWYSHSDGWDYGLYPDEHDLRCICRFMAEQKGQFSFCIDPSFSVAFYRAAHRLIQSGRLLLCYDDGRKIVRLPTDARHADSTGDRAGGVS